MKPNDPIKWQESYIPQDIAPDTDNEVPIAIVILLNGILRVENDFLEQETIFSAPKITRR